jgi:hypothetical protein
MIASISGETNAHCSTAKIVVAGLARSLPN